MHLLKSFKVFETITTETQLQKLYFAIFNYTLYKFRTANGNLYIVTQQFINVSNQLEYGDYINLFIL